MKILIVIIMVFFVSIGYSSIRSQLNINGNVTIVGGYLISMLVKDTILEPNVTNLKITYDGKIKINVVPKEGYFIYEANCNNNYIINNIITGIDSYNKKQEITIDNNRSSFNSVCNFYSRMVKANEVTYLKDKHSFKNVEEALNYLYLALGFEDITYESIVISYSNDNHKEFKTVKDALDYLYERLK